VGDHAVLAAGSVAVRNLEAGGVYSGNPAEFMKARVISAEPLQSDMRQPQRD
jgi:acetyltransferase-like isoleucine patch superfamily enzyme